MENIKDYKSFFLEHLEYPQVITLYHGTSKSSGVNLEKNGWQSFSGGIGGNSGNPRYLSLTSDINDAQWFANEQGEDTIVEVKDIPIEFLIPDPDDEAGFTMDDLLKRVNSISKYKLPSKFALTKTLNSSHFTII
jgi:hypothetical protein